MPRARKRIVDVGSAVMLAALIVADGFLWKAMIVERMASPSGVRTLHAGKSDTSLLITPSGAVVMQGAGPDEGLVSELERALPSGRDRIDLAIIPGQDENDYGGYAAVLDHYVVGAFLYNGRSNAVHPAGWKALFSEMSARRIPIVTVGAGDKVVFGRSAELDIVAPDAVMVQSADASDTRIVTVYNGR